MGREAHDLGHGGRPLQEPSETQKERPLLIEGQHGCCKCGGFVRRDRSESPPALYCANCGAYTYGVPPLPFVAERSVARLIAYKRPIA